LMLSSSSAVSVRYPLISVMVCLSLVSGETWWLFGGQYL
jgi:hypothetical protein